MKRKSTENMTELTLYFNDGRTVQGLYQDCRFSEERIDAIRRDYGDTPVFFADFVENDSDEEYAPYLSALENHVFVNFAGTFVYFEEIEPDEYGLLWLLDPDGTHNRISSGDYSF